MDHFVGIWWSGSEDDARPAGAEAKGYLALNFNGVGANFPAIQDIQKERRRQGQEPDAEGQGRRELSTTAASTNSVMIAEAIRNAQKLTGKKVVTGEDVRRGLETLNITAARWKELGLAEFAAPILGVSCTDHNGHHSAYMQQWDGAKWVKVSDWIAPMKDKVRPAARGGGQGLRVQEPAVAEAHRGLRQVVVIEAQNPGGGAARPPIREFAYAGAHGGIPRIEVTKAEHAADAPATTDNAARRARRPNPLGQQHRGDLRPRHPGAQGRVARRAEGRHRRAARRQRRRQDHHAEGDLQPAARRARRRHQGLDPVRGRRGAGPLAQRTGAPRLHPGDGRPALLRPSHHRGKPAHRRLHAARRQGRDPARHRPRSMPISPPAASAATRWRATPPAASSRCARSAAR